MIQSLILVLALCADTFGASLAYGANRIKVSPGKVLLLNGICSACLGLAMAAGSLAAEWIPGTTARIICGGSLFFLGLIRMTDYTVRKWIRDRCHGGCRFHFSHSGLHVIVQIWSDPMAADADGSRSLEWKEILLLGFAMSIDSLTAGAAAALSEGQVWITVFLAFAVGTVMMEGGLRIGRSLSGKRQRDLGWVSGLLLMGVGVSKL